MHSRSLCVLLRCLLLCSAFMLPARAQEASPEVLSFEQDILPLLRQNCLACHNSQLPEGGLNLESLALTKKGGDSGAAVTAKDLDNSLLWVRAAATDEDEVMPPMDNAVGAKRLTKEELDRLRRWIEQGAVAGEMGKGHQIVWQPIPEAQRAIYALDISPTDQLVACSRANRVTLYDLHTRAEVAKLVDPTLESEVGPGVADVAAINALAFSPDGRRLATGGFRTVRIWEQQAAVLPLPPGLHQRSPAMVLASSRAQVATVNSLGDVEIRDVNSGALLSRLVGQTAAIACLDWGAEALDLLVSGDVSGQIQLWRPSSEELLTELNCASSLQEIVLSADARFLAAVGEDGKVYCYRLTWGESGAGQGHVQAESVSVDFLAGVSCIEILQTSVPYLLAAAGQQVEVIDLNTATKVKSWGHETQVTAMLAHDAHVFTGSLDGTVQKWSLTSEERQGTVATDFVGQSMLLRWQADVARQTKTVDRLVEKSKQLQAALEKEVKALEAVQEARDKAAASSEESQQKLAAAQEKVVQSEAAIQKATTERDSIQQRVVASAARIEGQEAERRKVADALAEQRKQREQLARMLAEADQMLEKYETQDAQLESQINESKKEREVASQAEQQLTEELATYQKQLEAGKKELTAATEARKAAEAELSKREQALATSQQGKTRVEASIPVHESKLARERSQQGHLERELSRVNEAHSANRAVIDLALSPSGEKLALARRGGRIQFLTLGTGQVIESSLPTCDGIQFFSEHEILRFAKDEEPELRSSETHWTLQHKIGSRQDGETLTDLVTALAFHPDGNSLVVGSGLVSRFGEVKIFDSHTGLLLRDYGDVHSDTVLSLSFSPSGRVIASAAADKSVRLLDIASGRVVRSLDGHTHHVLSVAWQDNEQSIASVSSDKNLKIWEVASGTQRRSVGGFGKEITGIAFVGESSQVVSVSGDGQIRQHETGDGKMVRSMNSGDFLHALDVTSDGKVLVTGGETGQLRFWDLSAGRLIGEVK